jgi:sigma-E factor negative regulatory protein RseC
MRGDEWLLGFGGFDLWSGFFTKRRFYIDHRGTSMVTEEGVIEKIFRQKAVIRIQKNSACAHCDSRGACQVISDKEMLIEIANDLQAKVGDHVEISVKESSLVKLSLLVFFLPIVALVVGAYAGGALADSLDIDSTLSSVLGGALAMGITFFALRRLERAIKDKAEYHPRMTRILIRAESGGETREPTNASG